VGQDTAMSASRSPDNRFAQVPSHSWEKIAGFAFGVVGVAAMLVLAIAFPQPTSFQYEVFRIVLAIACGGVVAVIPGFLAVSMDAPGLAIRAAGALAVFLLVYFFNPARLVTSTSSLDVATIVGALEAQYKDRLASAETRETKYQTQITALTNAVTALAQQRSQPDAPPGVQEALAQLRQGNTQAAEMIFEMVLTRKEVEGDAANQQAAEAARHLGALAFLHDTEKALTAYRRAVALDPANAEGWNQLGHLLQRIGRLDEAVDAYTHVRAFAIVRNDQIMGSE
jgi:hypothetical protein